MSKSINQQSMDPLKIAIDWAKAEVFSSQFFILFGVLFVLATLGFWQWGKTAMAKAFIVPTLVAAILLLVIGLGLVFSNKSRIANFETAYKRDKTAFIASEITRADNTIQEYQLIVFKIIPLIIVVAALFLIFSDSPVWRAASITTIALLVVLLLVDSNAQARMKIYHEYLISYSSLG